jgi:hypothetical protein
MNVALRYNVKKTKSSVNNFLFLIFFQWNHHKAEGTQIIDLPE